MHIREQYEVLQAKNNALKEQQETLSRLQGEFVERLRQRANELAEVSTEFVKVVMGASCCSEPCLVLGEKWYDRGFCCCVVLDSEGHIHTVSSGGKGYTLFDSSYRSELGDATIEELEKDFKSLLA